MKFIVPAILPSSYQDLKAKLVQLDRIPPRRVQIDVVDGEFAWPASWPYVAGTELHSLVQNGDSLPHLDRIEYEADLMCKDPEAIATDLVNFGVTRLTLHVEATKDVKGLLERMRRTYSAEANFSLYLFSMGLAINVETDASVLEPFVDQLEYVQFMGIDKIGVQGQPFNPEVIDKVRDFRRKHPKTIIQIDGGVTLDNAKQLVEAGASRFIVGSTLLNAVDIEATFKSLESVQDPLAAD